MRPASFGDTKLKQEIAMKPLPWIINSILEYHKLQRFYKALCKIYMISIKYNTPKSYYAKSAMGGERVKYIVILQGAII